MRVVNQKPEHPREKTAWQIPRMWEGQTVVCIASGPSLTRDQVDYVRGRVPVIAINDNYQVAPWADMVYGCDHKWWSWHYQRLAAYKGLMVSTDVPAVDAFERLLWAQGFSKDGLCTEWPRIHHGGNSGHQVINIAYHAGAKRVVLLGYDMKFGRNGAAHWFGDHPDGVRSTYSGFIQAFQVIAKQRLIEIINCTRETALTCFSRQRLEDVL